VTASPGEALATLVVLVRVIWAQADGTALKRKKARRKEEIKLK